MSPRGIWIVGTLAVAAFLRLWQIDAVGYNSDEAVYSGQAAAIADDDGLEQLFPALRAHPVLIQTLLSLGYRLGGGELFGRVAMAVIGVATVYVVFRLGEYMYGRRTGLVAALLLALMPYHVVVTRQVLLDGPMTLFATVTLYLLARFAATGRVAWLYASGASMGMTFLSKETGIVLLGAIYAFLALSPAITVRLRDLAGSLGVMAAFAAIVPISLALAGGSSGEGNFLAWQLFRRANHDLAFYPVEVPAALGLLTVLLAALALWHVRRRWTWREKLLLAWIAVPIAFFELWPVKGFQYLLPIAPAVAILASRGLTSTGLWSALALRAERAKAPWLGSAVRDRRFFAIAIAIVALTLLVPTLNRIRPSDGGTFLAGTGGVPGGREAGQWIERHVPEGARMMTIGPSMANIVQFYGRRQANGLSVSPNPLNRNPAYEPLENPDRMIRDNEIQYLVWDGYSAQRSSFFARKLRTYANRYHGRVVHTETAVARTRLGRETSVPIITIYEVRP